jgi:hypothetical protein
MSYRINVGIQFGAALTHRNLAGLLSFPRGIQQSHRRQLQMRLHIKQFLGGIALIILAVPVWAHTDSTPLHSDGTTTIGGTQLKAGDYQLKVKDNATELQVTHDGKVVAQVPVKWIQLPNRPSSTEVVINNDQIVEVDFGGKTEAVQISSN